MGEIDQNNPDFSKPKEAALKHLLSKWHVLRQAPLAVCLLLVFDFVAGHFVAWKLFAKFYAPVSL
jgi:predicted MFS family arabinose efflux permease